MPGAIDDPIPLPQAGQRSAASLGQGGAAGDLPRQLAQPQVGSHYGQLTFDWGAKLPASVDAAEPKQQIEEPRRAEPAHSPAKSPALPVPQHSLRDRVERLLKEQRIPYVNVEEAKRALPNSSSLRAFHFVVYGNMRSWMASAVISSEKVQSSRGLYSAPISACR